MEENKIIHIDQYHNYQEIEQLTDDLRIRNTYLTVDDFKKADGWLDFEKICERPELYIIDLSMWGQGKTFGCSDYVLETLGENLGVISNTTNGAEIAVKELLGAFKQDEVEYFDDWTSKNLEALDGDGEVRIKAAGIRSMGNAKNGRSFYTSYIMWDEFNQNFEQAQMQGNSPIKTLDTIVKRWSNDYNHVLKHIFLFGNKDGKKHFLSTKIMEELGLYALSPYTECFIIERAIQGSDGIHWHPNVFVMNSKVDPIQQQKLIDKWLADPIRYRSNLSMVISGSAKVGMFNDDTQSWLFDNIDFKFKEDNSELIEKTWYLYQSDDNWFEFNLLKRPNGFRNASIYISRFKGQPDSKFKYSWNKPIQDGVYQLSFETKDEILAMISEDRILYKTAAAKMQFLQQFKK